MVKTRQCVALLDMYEYYSATCANDHLSPVPTSQERLQFQVLNESPIAMQPGSSGHLHLTPNGQQAAPQIVCKNIGSATPLATAVTHGYLITKV